MAKIEPVDETGDAARQLGAKIRAAREDRGWTQLQLCALIESTEVTLWRIESGARLPKAETLMRIAAALGCRVEDLLPDVYWELFRPKVWPAAAAGHDISSRRSSIRSKRVRGMLRDERGAASIEAIVAIAAAPIIPAASSCDSRPVDIMAA